jgi:hypothetical protein
MVKRSYQHSKGEAYAPQIAFSQPKRYNTTISSVDALTPNKACLWRRGRGINEDVGGTAGFYREELAR